MCSAGSARPDQAGFFLTKEQRMSTIQARAHVCTATAEPVTLPALTGLTDCSFDPLSNDLILIADAGQGKLVVSRHPSTWWKEYSPSILGAWEGLSTATMLQAPNSDAISG